MLTDEDSVLQLQREDGLLGSHVLLACDGDIRRSVSKAESLHAQFFFSFLIFVCFARAPQKIESFLGDAYFDLAN